MRRAERQRRRASQSAALGSPPADPLAGVSVTVAIDAPACAHCPCASREDCHGRATPCCRCRQIAAAYRVPEMFEEPSDADD